MPQPDRSSLHIDAVSTSMSIAYMQAQENFIATKAAPVIPTDKQTNKYFKFDKDAWFRDEAQPRKSAQETAGSGFTLSTDSYSCDVFGFHKDVDDLDRMNQDNPLDIDQAAVEFVTRIILLRQEVQWVADVFKTGVWATDKTVSAQWNDKTGSDPRDDIDAGKETVLSNTGFEPNTLILGYQVYRQLRRHPDVLDQFKYSTPDSITQEMLARFFDIGTLLVAKGVKNTAMEGQTFAGSFVHGKHALLAYVNPNPGLMQPSSMYTYSWTAVQGGFTGALGVARFRDELRRSDRFEALTGFDNKVTGSDLGYFFSSVVA